MPTYKMHKIELCILSDEYHRPGAVNADCNTSSRYFSAAAYCLFLSSIANAARALS
jgi:hypothetical protein